VYFVVELMNLQLNFLYVRSKEVRAERQKKALEAQQAEHRRLEEERFGIAFLCVYFKSVILL